MNSVWIRVRRLAASIMLVAVASLVLHGSAVASLHRHGPNSTDCATQASAGHVHSAAHKHSGGAAHHHAQVDHTHANAPDDGASGNQQAGANEPCCSSICVVALAIFGPDPVSVPIVMISSLLPMSQDGVSIRLDGLKRPPRTLGIV